MKMREVEVDAARLDDDGDITLSYSAGKICSLQPIAPPIRFEAADWIVTASLSRDLKWRWAEAYRIVHPSLFDGPTAGYNEHDCQGPQREEFGGYHGMRVKRGKEDAVMVGPPIKFVRGVRARRDLFGKEEA